MDRQLLEEYVLENRDLRAQIDLLLRLINYYDPDSETLKLNEIRMIEPIPIGIEGDDLIVG